jgi:hypothetical protein
MNKLILILSLVFSTAYIALSQESNIFKINPDNFNIPVIKYPESIMNTIAGDFKMVNPGYSFPSNKMNELFNKKSNIICKELIQSRKPISDYAKMPCIKPEGNFSLLILKPDSNIFYSMLIKPFGFDRK